MRINLGVEGFSSLNFYRAIFAEFFGTMLFLVCVTCVALSWGSPDISANNVEIGIGIGLAIASLAQAFGHVSGGHLNPAVTFGMMLGGQISIIQGFLYMVAQVLGGVAGSAITYGCTPSNRRDNLGVTALAPELKVEQAFALELIFTFMLVFFVFSITDANKGTEPYGTTLGIGVIIWVAHVCLIPFTGCGINPARSFGPAVIMDSWEDHWVYWVGPMLGGALAAPIYKFIFYAEKPDENSYQPAAGDTKMEKVSSA